jgi:hypothetical protein
MSSREARIGVDATRPVRPRYDRYENRVDVLEWAIENDQVDHLWDHLREGGDAVFLNIRDHGDGCRPTFYSADEAKRIGGCS